MYLSIIYINPFFYRFNCITSLLQFSTAMIANIPTLWQFYMIGCAAIIANSSSSQPGNYFIFFYINNNDHVYFHLQSSGLRPKLLPVQSCAESIKYNTPAQSAFDNLSLLYPTRSWNILYMYFAFIPISLLLLHCISRAIWIAEFLHNFSWVPFSSGGH